MTDKPMAPGTIKETPFRQNNPARGFRARLSGARLRTWLQPVTFLGMAMLAVVYGVLILLIVNDHRDATANAIRNGDNLVRIIDQSYSHIFESVDSTLQLLRRAHGQSKSVVELQDWLDDKAARTGLDYRFVIINDGGRVIAVSTDDSGLAASLMGANFSDREYFQRQRDALQDDLYLSAPLEGRISGRPAIILTRRLVAADGSFDGLVAAIVSPEALTRVGADLNLGRNGSFGLIGFDGVVRARAVNGKVDASAIGKRLPSDSKILSHVMRQPNGYFLNDPGTPDQNDRLVSYRVIGDFPMVATVSMTDAFIYFQADRQARVYWSIALLVTTTIFFGVRWGIARDRTLLATQDNLRRSQERYRLVEEAVNDGIWDWNIETDEHYRSLHWKAIAGVDAGAPAPNLAAFLTIVHPDDRALVKQVCDDHMNNDQQYKVEFRVQHPDGRYRWVQSRGKVQRNAGGEPVRMVGTLTDITERRQADAALKESRDNLSRAERLALLGHFKNDLTTTTITWSDGIFSIFGFSPEYTLTVRGFYEMLLPEDRPALKAAGAEVIAGREIPSLIVRARRPDGAIVDLELWMTPVRDGAGATTGIFGTIQDVTIRRRAEELLSRTNQELEARVSARTAELAQEMRRREEAQMTLGQMQKMEAVGQLTAGVAHDFNNLLAVIAGSLEFVDRAAARGLTADPELVDAAMRATRRGRELVRRLLAFSRQTPLRAEPTHIDQMVLDTLRLLQRTLGQNIELVTKLDAKGATISVDRNQFANALLNLAINARDAMPDGGQITIATDCRPCESALAKSSRWPTGEEVCITIADTGLGMTEDVLARAAEPFFTTKIDGLGSGLGLSMVQGFTEQSGGLFTIESQPQRGTSVSIRLPRISTPGLIEEDGVTVGGPAPEREKTVLVVEDDSDVRVVVTAQLRHLGYRVHAVTNGMEAIDFIASPATIDVLLTDIVLPGGLDGVELVKEAMQCRPGIGILCMSGYDPAHKHRKWFKMQNITFLEKPFTMHRLGQAVDAALAH